MLETKITSLRGDQPVLPIDAEVGTGGIGRYAGIQEALDSEPRPMYLWVKSGSYAGFTCANDNVYIYCEPNTTITSAITLSGDNVCLELGSGCDVQAVITLSGTQCSLLRRNGVDTDGVVVTGTECFVDGGGWGTIDDGGTANEAHTITGDDTILMNGSDQTTTGATGEDGIDVDANRVVMSGLKQIDAEESNTQLGTGADVLVIGCIGLDADTASMYMFGNARARLIGNWYDKATAAGSQNAFLSGAGWDDGVLVGNLARTTGTVPIVVDDSATNTVVVGNRCDGAVDEGSSGTGTTASNDETSF